MTRKLFTGTTNGLELWVDEQALENLRQERENRLAMRLGSDGIKIKPKANKPIRFVEVFIQEFLNDLIEQNGCWIPNKSDGNNGYNHLRFCGKQWVLHRMVYLLTRGIIDNPSVCHHCDNPPCCNPDHLFSGTQKMNSIDSVQKGRANRVSGELHPWARLTNSQVAEIRNQYRYHSKEFGTVALAKKYGVSQSVIAKVVLRQTYLE